MGVAGFHHTSFTVSDMERSLAFYRDLLELRVVVDRVADAPYLGQVTGFPDVQLRVVYLQPNPPDGHSLELIEYRTHRGQPQHLRTNDVGTAHLCFRVADLAATYEKLRAHGTTFVSAPVPITAGANAGGSAVYLRDPDGCPLELIQPPPPAAT